VTGTGTSMVAKAAVAKGIANHKQRGPIVAGDQVSCQGHQCSETRLTGKPSSSVCVGAPPGREPLPP
jgi:hypothetical protein